MKRNFYILSSAFLLLVSTPTLAIDLPPGFDDDVTQYGSNVMYQTSNVYGSISITDQPSQTLLFFNGGSHGSMFGNIDKSGGGTYFSNDGCGLLIDEEGDWEFIDTDEEPINNPSENEECQDLEDTMDRYSSFASAELEVIEADLEDIDPYTDNTIDDPSVQAVSCKNSKIIGGVAIVGVAVTVTKACAATIGLGCGWASIEGLAVLVVIFDWVEDKCT